MVATLVLPNPAAIILVLKGTYCRRIVGRADGVMVPKDLDACLVAQHGTVASDCRATTLGTCLATHDMIQ